jgi:hypothetical protein
VVYQFVKNHKSGKIRTGIYRRFTQHDLECRRVSANVFADSFQSSIQANWCKGNYIKSEVKLSMDRNWTMNMKSLDTPEFHRLDGFMQGMSGLISEGQYNWYFSVKGFGGTDLIAEKIVETVYPELKSESLNLIQCSPEEMVSEINQQLSEECPMWGDATRTAPVPLLPYDTAMWRLLKECIDYEHGQIFRYEPKDTNDVLHCGISGDFTFVIINEDQRQCLIINAANTD